MAMVSASVARFVMALEVFLTQWPQVDTIAATFPVTHSGERHMLTVRYSTPGLLELEDDTGAILTVPLAEVAADE
jgi:hypothetical protein